MFITGFETLYRESSSRDIWLLSAQTLKRNKYKNNLSKAQAVLVKALSKGVQLDRGKPISVLGGQQCVDLIVFFNRRNWCYCVRGSWQ